MAQLTGTHSFASCFQSSSSGSQEAPPQRVESGNPNPSIMASSAHSLMPSMSPLMDPSEFINVGMNNYALDTASTKFKTEHQIVVELLKYHPLRRLFTKQPSVPMAYLQQWWKNLTLVDNNLVSTIGNMEFTISLSQFRDMFNLPGPDGIEGKEDFDSLATSDKVCRDIIRMGYSGELPYPYVFKRKFLPPVWYCLFSIINRCLTGKIGGQDQGNLRTLLILQGIARSKHYDFASLIWEDIKTNLGKRPSHIPYQRFWQVMINGAMRGEPSLQRIDAEEAPKYKMDSLRPSQSLSAFLNHRVLSPALLSYIPIGNQVLNAYRVSMGLSIPTSPAQETQPLERGEGSLPRVGGGASQG